MSITRRYNRINGRNERKLDVKKQKFYEKQQRYEQAVFLQRKIEEYRKSKVAND